LTKQEEFENLEFTELSEIQQILDVKIKDEYNVTNDTDSDRGDDVQQASEVEDMVGVESKKIILRKERPKRKRPISKDKVLNIKNKIKLPLRFLCERDGCGRSFKKSESLEVHLLTHDKKRVRN
jgi:hypothetical protein